MTSEAKIEIMGILGDALAESVGIAGIATREGWIEALIFINKKLEEHGENN